MLNQNARPKFGAKKKTETYYSTVQAYIRSLQPTKTLRQIAEMLNQAGYRSPTDKPFSRQTVANFMRSRSI